MFSPRRRAAVYAEALMISDPLPRYSTAVDKPWQAQRAAVLAIGKANPANCMPQDEYADWYFRVTKSDHFAQLKAKMKKICEILFNFLLASLMLGSTKL
ncbi:hypothetical protein EJB05_27080, partial [Eragrostis curvula]